MPEGAGLVIDSGILGKGVVCVCVYVGERRRPSTMVAVLMRTCQCCYIYINLVDPFKIMSNECAEVKRLEQLAGPRSLSHN